jgi:hypothetical protein
MVRLPSGDGKVSGERSTLGDEVDELLRRFAGPELVSPSARRALRTVLGGLPAELSGIYGFECRLGTADEQTDFFMRVTPDRSRRWSVPSPDRHWRGIGRILDLWTTPGTMLSTDVRHLWFEFDAAIGETVAVAAPGILFVHPRLPADLERAEWVRRQVAIAVSTWHVAAARPLDGGAPARLTACLESLPPGGNVFCLGVMVGRATTAIRLCLKDLPKGSHVPYLRRVGFPGADRLIELLRVVEPHVDAINLDLDVGAEVGPVAHLEMRCDEEVAPGAVDRWREFVGVLIDHGLVERSKADAFLSWPGLPVEEFGRHRDDVLVLRKLSHVKLAWRPDGPVEAKGYFGAWECGWTGAPAA